jgi:hypothetical protein
MGVRTCSAERLAVWPILSTREGEYSARAAANVEAVLERAKPYGVLVTVVQKVTVVNPLSLSGLSLLTSCKPLG